MFGTYILSVMGQHIIFFLKKRKLKRSGRAWKGKEEETSYYLRLCKLYMNEKGDMHGD